MAHPATNAALSGSKRKTTHERLVKSAYLARLAADGYTVHDIIVTTGHMAQAVQREHRDARKQKRRPDPVGVELRFLDREIRLAEENRAAIEQHGRPMWLPLHGGSHGQQLEAAELWRQLNPAPQRLQQVRNGTVHPWIQEGDRALQLAQDAVRHYPGITRFLTGRSHPPIPRQDVHRLGLRRAIVQAVIWYLQEQADQRRLKREHRRSIRNALEEQEAKEADRRLGRDPGLEPPAVAEAYSAYAIKEYQDPIEVALGELERGDVTTGDYAAILSRDRMGRRLVKAIEPLQDTMVVSLHLLVKHDAEGRIHVHARFQGQDIFLPDELRQALVQDAAAHNVVKEIRKELHDRAPTEEASLAAINARQELLHDVQQQRAWTRQRFVDELQRVLEHHAPFAVAMTVTLRGEPWHDTQFLVYNALMGQDVSLVQLSVLQHPHQAWEVKAAVNGLEVPVPDLLSVDAVGAARYPDNGYLTHLVRSLCSLRHAYARGSRLLMVHVRGPMMTWEGSRKRYRFCQSWLGLLDPVGKKGIEYVLFDGAAVSIPNVLRSADAYRRGFTNRAWKDLGDSHLFDVGVIETKLDAVQAVIRYMYHCLPKAFREKHLDTTHPRSSDLRALVPPEDWELFQANLDALWDERASEPRWDFDARDFQRPRRVEPYVAYTEDFSGTVEIYAEA